MFASHIKTKTHEKWLQDLNANKANFYIENKKLRDLIQSQKIMIGRMEVDLMNKSLTIDYLTQQVMANQSKIKPTSANCNDLMLFE